MHQTPLRINDCNHFCCTSIHSLLYCTYLSENETETSFLGLMHYNTVICNDDSSEIYLNAIVSFYIYFIFICFTLFRTFVNGTKQLSTVCVLQSLELVSL